MVNYAPKNDKDQLLAPIDTTIDITEQSYDFSTPEMARASYIKLEVNQILHKCQDQFPPELLEKTSDIDLDKSYVSIGDISFSDTTKSTKDGPDFTIGEDDVQSTQMRVKKYVDENKKL